MKRALIVLAILLLVAGGWMLTRLQQPNKITFAGGPQGGTFILFAQGLASLLEKNIPDLQIRVQNSGGSVANLVTVDGGKAELALVYAGDAFLGRHALLKGKARYIEGVLALGRVYGSSAQLVVSQYSSIRSPYDLVQRRIAIGSSGSGAAHSAERYFRALGIWDQITPLYLGYDLGIKELVSRRAEAVWQLVGAPSASISAFSEQHPVRLLNLNQAAEEHHFFSLYPFYTKTLIPPGTYAGQHAPVETFEDNTLLVTNPAATAEFVSQVLTILYSPKGMAAMQKAHPVGKDLALATALQGINIPLHPAAETFWRAQGVLE